MAHIEAVTGSHHLRRFNAGVKFLGGDGGASTTHLAASCAMRLVAAWTGLTRTMSSVSLLVRLVIDRSDIDVGGTGSGQRFVPPPPLGYPTTNQFFTQ